MITGMGFMLAIYIYVPPVCACSPEDVVDGDDVLVLGVLGVTDDGGASLDPNEPAMFVHQSVVLR